MGSRNILHQKSSRRLPDTSQIPPRNLPDNFTYNIQTPNTRDPTDNQLDTPQILPKCQTFVFLFVLVLTLRKQIQLFLWPTKFEFFWRGKKNPTVDFKVKKALSVIYFELMRSSSSDCVYKTENQ